MKNLKSYTDNALLTETKDLVEKERLTTLELIECLAEVESRMLYSRLGYSSLWTFCVEYLHLSEGSAQRRIQAMRLSKQVPEVKQSIAEGALSLSNASKLESFFRNEKKSGRPQSMEQKQQTIEQIKGLSQSQCEKKLFEISPQFEMSQKEVLKSVSMDQNVLKVMLDSTTVEKLKLLKDRLAHRLPDASYTEIITLLIEDKLNQIEKKLQPKEPKPIESKNNSVNELKSEISSQDGPADAQPQSKTKSTISTATAIVSKRKDIPIDTLRSLSARSGIRCEYVSPQGKHCNSAYCIEVDHILPIAMGGTNELSNLRHVCRIHNGLFAVDQFGAEYMKKYMPRLAR
jgi:HNH endonuclease